MKSAMFRIAKTGLTMVLSLACALSSAATFVLDDSQSQVLNGALPLQWRSISPAKGDHQVVGTTRVNVRINTEAWQGKTGRIFMVLPAQTGSSVLAQWQTQGLLLGGQLSSGNRALVWQGTISQTMIEDVMTVTIQADGRKLQSAALLRFHFELDLP
jgi:hypothetical protein